MDAKSMVLKIDKKIEILKPPGKTYLAAVKIYLDPKLFGQLLWFSYMYH